MYNRSIVSTPVLYNKHNGPIDKYFDEMDTDTDEIAFRAYIL